jgi:hypothetical protein
VRISILAGEVSLRPDTLTQTGQIIVSKSLANGARHSFFEQLERLRVARAGEPKGHRSG